MKAAKLRHYFLLRITSKKYDTSKERWVLAYSEKQAVSYATIFNPTSMYDITCLRQMELNELPLRIKRN